MQFSTFFERKQRNRAPEANHLEFIKGHEVVAAKLAMRAAHEALTTHAFAMAWQVTLTHVLVALVARDELLSGLQVLEDFFRAQEVLAIGGFVLPPVLDAIQSLAARFRALHFAMRALFFLDRKHKSGQESQRQKTA